MPDALTPRSRGRMAAALAAIALSIVLLHALISTASESLATAVSTAWAAMIVVYLMYRWRVFPPTYDVQLSEIRKLIELQPLIGDTFLPIGPWALAPGDLIRLVSTIQYERYESIVECGTGVSTIAIGRLLRQSGRGHLYSLEEDKAWHDVMATALSNEGLGDFVTLLHAPLEDYPDADAQWYSREQVAYIQARTQHIDLVLVDGPKSESTYARYQALPVFYSQLSQTSLIVLDDSRRPNERAVLDRWNRRFALSMTEYPDSQKGQVYIRLLGPRDHPSRAHRQLGEVP